jgi:hypothetical protein
MREILGHKPKQGRRGSSPLTAGGGLSTAVEWWWSTKVPPRTCWCPCLAPRGSEASRPWRQWLAATATAVVVLSGGGNGQRRGAGAPLGSRGPEEGLGFDWGRPKVGDTTVVESFTALHGSSTAAAAMEAWLWRPNGLGVDSPPCTRSRETTLSEENMWRSGSTSGSKLYSAIHGGGVGACS